MKQKLLIPFADYVRIYTTIYSVLESDKARTHRACKFFGYIGAAILAKHYNLNALPMAGAALYCVEANNSEMTNVFYGREEDGYYVSDPGAFHCWIQCEGYLLDFHAPLIRYVQIEEKSPVRSMRKMMQKPLAAQAQTLSDIEKPGDFFLMPNPELALYFVDDFAVGLAKDLANIAVDWYKKPSKNMASKITTMNKHGDHIPIHFKAPMLEGVW